MRTISFKNLKIILFAIAWISIITTCTDSKDELNNSHNTVQDIDGNVYHTIKIGNQIWTVENLKTTRLNNGEIIPNVSNSADWFNLTTKGWALQENNNEYESTYGKLYNWYAVETGNLCPDGWHVPTEQDWNILTEFLGGEEIAGGKMKSVGLTYWDSPNGDATNTSGFSGLPGGYRNFSFNAEFNSLKGSGCFWSASIENDMPYERDLYYAHGALIKNQMPYKGYGLSVRCVKN